jgi:stage III sporulation protein AB
MPGIKMIGAVLFIFASSVTGFIGARRFTERCRVLQTWVRVLEIIHTEIGFQSRMLPEVFRRVAILTDDPRFASAFNRLADGISYGSDFIISQLWNEMLQAQRAFLSRSDHLILNELGSYLGYTDRLDQLEKVKACKAGVESNLRVAVANRDSKVKIYRYLGFAVGSIIVLWLI